MRQAGAPRLTGSQCAIDTPALILVEAGPERSLVVDYVLYQPAKGPPLPHLQRGRPECLAGFRHSTSMCSFPRELQL